ncbi:MAG: thioredoxin family protein [Planctomycetes bacterium]|nr:thioredoxin family protein [Planctomycetota bacterium]
MPHLKTLVERHKDDPFVLLGVNYGDDEQAYRDGLKKFEVTWTCAYAEAERNPIVNLFEVEAFPTFFLLDENGKILYTGHSVDAVDDLIAKGVAKIKGKEGKDE